MAFSLATFNVKDLFEASGRYAPAFVEEKIANLAELLARADADVVGLQEIGSAEIVAKLVARLPRGAEYAPAIVGTRDARGIGCALFSRRPILAAEVHTAETLAFPVFAEGDAPPFGARLPLRRGVVHAEIRDGDRAVHVFVAHFKSKRWVPLRDAAGVERPPTTERAFGEAQIRSVVWRAAEALFVRGLVDDVLAPNADADVAVIGDLNDVPDSTTLRIVSGRAVAPLHSCAELVPSERRWSALHFGEKSQIDHVLASTALRSRATRAEFLNEALRDHGPLNDAAPPTVDSDHAPFVVHFR